MVRSYRITCDIESSCSLIKNKTVKHDQGRSQPQRLGRPWLHSITKTLRDVGCCLSAIERDRIIHERS